MNRIYFILILWTTNVTASDYFVGNISRILNYTNSNQYVLVKMDGSISNKPTCATNTSYDYAFDITTDQGKAAFSAFLAAYSAGNVVKVYGSDACTIHSSIEDLVYVESR